MVGHVMFLYFCVVFRNIIMHISVIKQEKVLDFYMNIQYTMVKTFKEAAICIERLRSI